MDGQKNDLIYSLFLKLLDDLKNLSNKDAIGKGDIESIVKLYEKKLKAAVNKNPKQKPSFTLKFGESYLIDEEKPLESYNIFKQAVSRGSNGLFITRTNPESISFYDSMKNIKFIWLSKVGLENRKDFSSLQPTDLTIIANSISEFIKNNTRGVIFLDGIELLSASNGFSNLAKALTMIKDMVSAGKGVLLVSTNLKALKDEEKNFLLREFNQIPVP